MGKDTLWPSPPLFLAHFLRMCVCVCVCVTCMSFVLRFEFEIAVNFAEHIARGRPEEFWRNSKITDWEYIYIYIYLKDHKCFSSAAVFAVCFLGRRGLSTCDDTSKFRGAAHLLQAKRVKYNISFYVTKILSAETSLSEEKVRGMEGWLKGGRGMVDTHVAFKFLVAVWAIFCSIDDDRGSVT